MRKQPRLPELPGHMRNEEPHSGKDFSDCKSWLDHARYVGLFPPQLDSEGREVGVQLLELLINARYVLGTRKIEEWSYWASTYPSSAAPWNEKKLGTETEEEFQKRRKKERDELAVRTRFLRMSLLTLLRLIGVPPGMRSDLSKLLSEPKVPKAKARVRAQAYVIANPTAKPAEVAKATGYKQSEVSRDRKAGKLAGVGRGLGRPPI